MRKILALVPALALLAACNPTAPTSVGAEVVSRQSGIEGARQHCLMLLKPHIPSGTPALESKLVSGNDAQNGDKVLRLPYTYGTSGVRMDARCHYTVVNGDEWQFSRLTLTPRYPERGTR